MRRSIVLSGAALAANLDAIRSADPAAVIDVRADAYGHGAVLVAERVRKAGLVAGERAGDAEATAFAYGIAPGSAAVMTVQGEVVATKRLAAGEPVSYGYTYRVERDTTVALVGLGYADGIPRRASSAAHVGVAGVPRLIAGRIAMDQFMADLGQDDAAPGEAVVLWGGHGAPRLAEWEAATGFPALALTAGLGVRFRREWCDA